MESEKTKKLEKLESKKITPPENPTKENPYARILRKIDEERRTKNPSGAA
jgi:hypothetical protein